MSFCSPVFDGFARSQEMNFAVCFLYCAFRVWECNSLTSMDMFVLVPGHAMNSNGYEFIILNLF